MSRVRGPVAPPPARTTSSTNGHKAQAKTERPAGRQPAVDVSSARAEEIRLAGALTRARVASSTPANVTGAGASAQAAAEQVRQAYGNPQGQTYPMNAARELAQQLRAGDSHFRQQLMAELAKSPQMFADILRAAGGDPFQNAGNVSDRTTPITHAERQIIAQALGSAYDAGAIAGDTVRQMIQAEPLFNLRHGSANGDFVGLLIAQSGSTDLMRDYATSVIAFVRDAPTPHAERMLNSAARAMAGSPDVLNDMVSRLRNGDFAGPGAHTPITLSGFIERLSAYQVPGFDMPVSGTRTTALGDILTTAAQASLDTKLALFQATISHGQLDRLSEYNAGDKTLEALTNLYCSDARAITDRLNSPADLRNHGMVTMSRFFQRTLFNSLLSDGAKDNLVQTLSDLAGQYRDEHRPNALGRLSGTITNGFALSVRDQRDREQATRDLIKLVFDIVPVPKKLTEIFGKALGEAVGEHLGRLIVERGVKGAQEAFTRYLSEQLTQGWGGILGAGAWADVKNANDVDAILKGLFDLGSLRDPDPATPENEAITTHYEQGIDSAERALRNEGITVRP